MPEKVAGGKWPCLQRHSRRDYFFFFFAAFFVAKSLTSLHKFVYQRFFLDRAIRLPSMILEAPQTCWG